MLLNSQVEITNIKTPVYASLALAFAGIGDAFLYPFLPVNRALVGVPVTWVGIILSINRFVRIFSNAWMVHLFSNYGFRTITIIAVSLAIISTAGYAVATSVTVWLALRICWGLSFSAMRISTLGYALQQSKYGFALGITKSIQEAGSMIALILRPLLLSYFHSRTIFIPLAVVSLPALYFAWNLPKGNDRVLSPARKTFLQLPSTFNTITFVSAFLIDGIIVIVLGVLFLDYNVNITLLTATTMAALYLGYRRICLVIFSTASGWLADRIGIARVFNISLGIMIVGLFILSTGYIEVGSIIVFTFYSINAAITPGNLLKGKDHPLAAVAENATWRDIGAAMGTLTGGVLLTLNHPTFILLLTTFSLSLLFLIHLGAARKAFNFLYLWK